MKRKYSFDWKCFIACGISLIVIGFILLIFIILPVIKHFSSEYLNNFMRKDFEIKLSDNTINYSTLNEREKSIYWAGNNKGFSNGGATALIALLIILFLHLYFIALLFNQKSNDKENNHPIHYHFTFIIL